MAAKDSCLLLQKKRDVQRREAEARGGNKAMGNEYLYRQVWQRCNTGTCHFGVLHVYHVCLYTAAKARQATYTYSDRDAALQNAVHGAKTCKEDKLTQNC